MASDTVHDHIGARLAEAPSSAAITSFAQFGLHRRAISVLLAQGITAPTPIQAHAIPALLAGRDVVGQSRTGSGKTLAFGLPLLERVDPRVLALQALVLVPTRELASQVAGVLREVDAGRGIRVVELVGGRALGPQRHALEQGAHVAVGAPGRVLDHLRSGSLDLRALRVIVLDEADHMLDAGFAPDVERILARTPSERQTVMFSATMPEWTAQIVARHLKSPVRITVGEPDGQTEAAITQRVYIVPEGNRTDALRALLDRRDEQGVTLVFGRTKHGVKRLAKRFESWGYPIAALQGNLSQNARDRVMADFRAGKVRILLATNVAARGLDVLDIAQVINYELPESAELFTHRIGRTGRMDREGEAITLVTPSDMPAWKKLRRDLTTSPIVEPWPSDSMPLPPPTPTSALEVERDSQEHEPRTRRATPSRTQDPRQPQRPGGRERGTRQGMDNHRRAVANA
jgi:ATP-dependent RNA helicase DeaD